MAASLNEPMPTFAAPAAAAAATALSPPRAVQVLTPRPKRSTRFEVKSYDDDKFRRVLQDPAAFPEFKNFVHNTDGDIPQLNALTGDKLHDKGFDTIEEICKHKQVFKHCLMKIAAGCSLTQSPNDGSYCHMEAKRVRSYLW